VASTVAVLGGGVAGMSAAHELIQRGFEVTVYETRDIPGGKARSMPVEGTGQDGRPDLPGEHGFRFFPGFYRHLPDTMSRIPYGTGGQTVLDNLTGADELQIARAGNKELLSPARFPASLDDLEASIRFLCRYATETGVRVDEFAYFMNRLLLLLTSCEERRFAEYENESWWEFSGAGQRGEPYQLFLADGLTRSLVAARARELSARTGGYTLLQLLFDMSRAGRHVDRVLKGPTNDVWITPWLEFLRDRGVDYRFRHDVQALHCADGRLNGLTVVSEAGPKEVTADYYLAALPVEQMRMLVGDEVQAADPGLSGLHELETRWMNGIMFYLDSDVEVVEGHTIYIDSEWSLTSISQQQFWDVDLESFGDGRVEGILSIDVSEWRRPGRNGKVAFKCNREEIKDEVWAQLEAHLNDDERKELNRANLLSWFLDPAIQFPNPIEATNLEPLLINTPGSWEVRPDAVPRERRERRGGAVENLFLASDYVRTFTDLATMEGANEAARRAVNGILEADGSDPDCPVWPLEEPRIFALAQALDRLLFKLGRPPPKVAVVKEDGRVESAGPLGSVVTRLPRSIWPPWR
jgi:uncharacterized protein with NAD-binding domain and iron-sulfur cluster